MKKFLLLFLLPLSFSANAQFSGNALDFDGANDMVVCSTVPSFFSSPGTNDFTIEAWVNPRASVFARILFAQPATNNFVSFGTGSGNVIYFYVIVNGTTHSVATTTSITQNQWTHVAARWTASTNSLAVFFNGVQQATTGGGTSSTGTNGLMVLGSRPGGFQYFNGALDEVRVWNEARTLCEIQNNMNNSITGAQTNLVANYDFNQGVAGGNNAGVTTLNDLSGNAFNGAVTNFALSGATSNWISSAATVTTQGNPLGGVTVPQGATICSGGSFTFPDGTVQTNITSQVMHTSTLQTVNGCDSIINTTVFVSPTYSINETASVCPGDSFTFPDGTTQTNITSQVTHASMLQASTGCDSTINTTVNVNPTYSMSDSAMVCSGGSYTFPDGTTQSNITSQISYVSNMQTLAGCDSVISTTVNVNPAYSMSDSAVVCFGSSYTFPDGSTTTNITSAFSHNSMLFTVAGCDSTIATSITVIQVNDSVIQTGVTLVAYDSAAAYQWLDCLNGYAPIPGETNQAFTPVVAGDYALAITANGCTDTSACFAIPLSVGDVSALPQVSIYPNPAREQVFVDFEKNSNVVIELIEISGAVVRRIPFNGTRCTIDMTELASGVYWISVLTQEGRIVKAVVKE